MEIKTLILGSLQTNCYLVYEKETKQAIIIDPADEGQFIIQKIQDLHLKPVAIVATHGHFDHLLAATELRLTLNIPFLMHKDDLFLLNSIESRAKYYTNIKADPPLPPEKFITENNNIAFGNESLVVICTPGHTSGSICLYSKKNKLLFTGDTIFKEGVGRTDYSYSSKKDLTNSIKEKIFYLPKDTIIYPGHGGETSIGSEKNLSLR